MHQATRMQGMRAVHEDDWIILLAQNTARGLRVEQILTLVAALELFKAWTQSRIDDWSAPDAPCTIHAWRADNGCKCVPCRGRLCYGGVVYKSWFWEREVATQKAGGHVKK